MKKLILLSLFILAGCTYSMPKFNVGVPDTVTISSRDSLNTYDSTMVFAVAKNISGQYRWKKMFFYQLKNILNSTLSISNLLIPRLIGTPTTNIGLLTFASDSIYRADFDYNFRKIDSLSVVFDLNDFTISGDTVRIKSTYVPDSALIAGQATLAGGANVLIGGYGVGYAADDFVKVATAENYGTIYLDYSLSNIIMDINSSYKTLKGLFEGDMSVVTATDSTLTIVNSGAYYITMTATVADTGNANIFMALFVNNTRAAMGSVMFDVTSSFERTTISSSCIIYSTAGDVFKQKFMTSNYGGDRLTFYNVNFNIHRIGY